MVKIYTVTSSRNIKRPSSAGNKGHGRSQSGFWGPKTQSEN